MSTWDNLSDKAKDRLAKVVKLSEQGVDGEAIAATVLLQKLCEKYDLDVTEVVNEIMGSTGVLEWYSFRYKTKHEKQLLVQVICWVLQERKRDILQLPNQQVETECTALDALEIEQAFAHYKAQLNKEMERLVTAFFYKHDLFRRPELTKQIGVPTPKTFEQVEEEQRLARMARSLETAPLRKGLGQ